MGITTKFEKWNRGITIPYEGFRKKERTNHGFVDLRGRPDLAKLIAETTGSRALQRLLVLVAERNQRIMTVGCDLGEHSDASLEPQFQQVAGGYVHLSSAPFLFLHVEAWNEVLQPVKDELERRVGGDEWEVKFYLEKIYVELDGFDEYSSAVKIDFHALARSRQKARNSRERLIEAMVKGLYGGR